MKVCPKCEAQYADSMRFCNRCGCPLNPLPEDDEEYIVRERNSRGFAPVFITLIICFLLVVAIVLASTVISNRRIKEAYSAAYAAAYRDAYEQECRDCFYLFEFGRKIGYDIGVYDSAVQSGLNPEKPSEQDSIAWFLERSNLGDEGITESGKRLLDKYSVYYK